MKARIKGTDFIINVLYDEEKLMYKRCFKGLWEYYREDDIEILRETCKDVGIDWQSVRKDIAMEILKQITYNAYNDYDRWINAVFNSSDMLTQKLMKGTI